MKKRRYFVPAVMAGMVCAGAAMAQSTDAPSDYDSVIAAPEQHKILLETDDVRVLEVTIAPGVVEPFHDHRWPSVLYFQSAGDFLDRDQQGNILMDSRTMDPPLNFPVTMASKPKSVPHSIENLSQTETIRMIRFELKNASPSSN